MARNDKRAPTRAIVEAQIDENLRRIFQEDADGDVPAHLEALVAQLGEIDMPPDDERASTSARDASPTPHHTNAEVDQ